MKKENIIGIVSGLALILGVFGLFNAGPQGPQGPQGTNGSDGVSLGAIAGDEVQGNRFCVGGSCTYRYVQNFKLGTTTACSVRVPGDGRRVILTSAFVDIRNSTGTAWSWRMGTSTTGSNAISTILTRRDSITGAEVMSFMASPASSTAAASFPAIGIIGTTTAQHINVDIGGTAVLPLSPVTKGSCTFNFQELP